jgi:transcription termination factor Rho
MSEDIIQTPPSAPASDGGGPSESSEGGGGGKRRFFRGGKRPFFRKGKGKRPRRDDQGENAETGAVPDEYANGEIPAETSAEATASSAEGSGDTPRSEESQQRQPPPERPLGPPEPAEGVLELSPKGYGFLRQRDRAYSQHPQDCFVAPEFIRKYGLREGMAIKGEQRKGHRGPQLTDVSEVNKRAPEAMRDLPLFEELKAINPNKRIQLETVPTRLTTRVIDMITPVGRGQRGLIVAPPRAGKTTLLQHTAEAIVQNHPQMHLMILLVDERPEEVTEFRRAIPQAEIYASSNDSDIKSHIRIAQFAIERAKRLVECGEHVFMLMDSITRMARAFNNAKQGGATMSGGMGVGALEIPRRLFAAARNTRTAGSLTILATALIETGSRMDDLIFQEFKGTGNMELVLDRKIAEQFFYPAVNIFKSGTRREELLLPAFQLEKIHMLRRGLAGHKPIDAIQRVLGLLERFPNNAQMLVELPSK